MYHGRPTSVRTLEGEADVEGVGIERPDVLL